MECISLFWNEFYSGDDSQDYYLSWNYSQHYSNKIIMSTQQSILKA